ncbi:sensor domain-containing protein [Cellulomonas citrea]|uniref:sensor domain-containing protein n=1 Tax=Cellulomonas citrea TaxID=1909423 RepID=UPI001359FDBD|nr:EAL domain-containing protein [Cellulomonas citrea]
MTSMPHGPVVPAFTPGGGAPAPSPLQVGTGQVPQVLSSPLDLLATQAPLVVTVDLGLRVEYLAGRLAPSGGVGRRVDRVLAELPELVAVLHQVVEEHSSRRLDVRVGGRVLKVVAQPVVAGGRVRGAVLVAEDVTAVRTFQRRAAMLAQMTVEQGAAQDDPDAVMGLVVRAVTRYVRAPATVRTMVDGRLVVRAGALPGAQPDEAVPVPVEHDGPVTVGPLLTRLMNAGGPVVVPWADWVAGVDLRPEVVTDMEALGARAVVAWPMRADGHPIGLLVVVAVDGDRVQVDTDVVEQLFLADLAGRAALVVEHAQLRSRTARAIADLAESESRFRSAFSAAPVGMLLISTEPTRPGTVVAANATLAGYLGRPEQDLVGRLAVDLVHPADADLLAVDLADLADGTLQHSSREHRVLRGDGTVSWVRTELARAQDTGGPHLLVAHVTDVSERRRVEEELARRALYDGLTGLASRHLAMDQLHRVLDGLREEPGVVAVLYADLDRFKAINDTFGRDVGDQVLTAVGSRLQGVVRHQAVVARVGGDEILVVCPQAGSPQGVHELAARVLGALERPFVVRTAAGGTASVHVSASLGVTSTSDPEALTDQLVHEADTAMHEAKRLGRHRSETFTERLGIPATRWLRVENDLRAAMVEDRMVLHYQPIIDLGTGRISGVEALLRMTDPARGLVPPGEFIDVAEESSLTYRLGDWVVNEACRQLEVWQHIAPTLTMAVNVTGRQVAEAARSGAMVDVVRSYGLAPETLCLEVTERTLLDAADAVVEDLEGLTRAGIRMSIDDFGTGYSSLTYLQRFPVDTLKIDQSFVAGLGVSSRDDAIVTAVVALGSALGLRIVAEGVETPKQLAALRALGCPYAQGYHLGRPMPAEALGRLLAAGA